MNPATNKLLGSLYNFCGESTCMITPSFNTTILVPNVIASVWSCVTEEVVAGHEEATFETDVTGYELLGSEVLLYVTAGGAAVTAKVDSRTPARLGDHIKLAIDVDKIHCFDKETELTITN